VATVAPFVLFGFIHFYTDLVDPYSLFVTVGLTTVAWLVATFVTQPTDMQVLKNFYSRIQPEGFWQPVGVSAKKSQIPQLLGCWLLGIGLGYACLFCLGTLIFADWQGAMISGVVAVVCALGISRLLGSIDVI